MCEFDLQSRLLVLKAHLLGREVMNEMPNQGAALSSEICALARRARKKLETHAECAESLRRRVFYALVEAECLRRFNPAKFRAIARECGERLASRYHAANPYPLYLSLVEATTGVTNRAVAGDITAHSATAVRSEMVEITDGFGNLVCAYSRPARAVGLNERDLSAYAAFLFKYDITTIASKHGLED